MWVRTVRVCLYMLKGVCACIRMYKHTLVLTTYDVNQTVCVCVYLYTCHKINFKYGNGVGGEGGRKVEIDSYVLQGM